MLESTTKKTLLQLVSALFVWFSWVLVNLLFVRWLTLGTFFNSLQRTKKYKCNIVLYITIGSLMTRSDYWTGPTHNLSTLMGRFPSRPSLLSASALPSAGLHTAALQQWRHVRVHDNRFCECDDILQLTWPLVFDCFVTKWTNVTQPVKIWWDVNVRVKREKEKHCWWILLFSIV